MDDDRRPDEPDEEAAGRALRTALEPAPGAVERVVRGALAGRATAERAGSMPRRLAAPIATAVVLAAALWLLERVPPDEPAPTAPVLEPAQITQITNVGGILVARSGGRTLVVRTAGAEARSAGHLIIRYRGGER